jgi:hypothetical protein
VLAGMFSALFFFLLSFLETKAKIRYRRLRKAEEKLEKSNKTQNKQTKCSEEDLQLKVALRKRNREQEELDLIGRKIAVFWPNFGRFYYGNFFQKKKCKEENVNKNCKKKKKKINFFLGRVVGLSLESDRGTHDVKYFDDKKEYSERLVPSTKGEMDTFVLL